MEVSQSLHTPENSNQVCRLSKALYGLKQAPRQWYAKIDTYLIQNLGFKSSLNDPCLYIQHKSSKFTVIALYVDRAVEAATPVLKDLYPLIQPGFTHAFVGWSGSGKSPTICWIERFYDVNYGVVTIDGRHVRQLNVR